MPAGYRVNTPVGAPSEAEWAGGLGMSHTGDAGSGQSRSVPPPPAWFLDSEPEPEESAPGRRARREAPRPNAQRFDADIDVCELDERGRPGSSWTAKGRAISRSSFVMASKRMCYPGRQLLVSVHLIDDRPVALMGRVHECEYESDGLYRVDLDLLPVPEHGPAHAWFAANRDTWRGKKAA